MRAYCVVWLSSVDDEWTVVRVQRRKTGGTCDQPAPVRRFVVDQLSAARFNAAVAAVRESTR
jgi:hypothetical protein